MRLSRPLFFCLAAMVLQACGGPPPTFPSQPPAQIAPGAEKREPPPPPPKGVASVEMTPAARSQVLMTVGASAALFLVVLILCFLLRRSHAASMAGIAAAFLVPMIAVGFSARQYARIFSELGAHPMGFAEIAVAIWNENQPVLFGFYGGTAALFILLIVVAYLKDEQGKSSWAPAVMVTIGMLGAVTGFSAFISMNRLTLAVIDPVQTDSLVRSIQRMSLAGVSQAVAFRLLAALSLAAISSTFFLLTIVLALTAEQSRKNVAVVLIALLIMIGCASVERSWCFVLETTARSGRVPVNTLLTR